MKRESCENHELSRNCKVTEVFIKKSTVPKVWEGNKEVTSQETCHFFSDKNFRDLKFVDLIVLSETFSVSDLPVGFNIFHFRFNLIMRYDYRRKNYQL